MANQLVSGFITQGTTAGLEFANQLITGGSKQGSSQACIVDLTPPVFSGIDFLSRGALGQLRASWLPGTDATLPISYEVYVKPLTSFNLFDQANVVGITRQLSYDIFNLPNGTLLQSGTLYYVGVRAVDAVGNRDINTVILDQTSPGILGVTSGQISGVFAINSQNQLIASFWANDAEGVIDNPARLGPASYAVYDKDGNLVPSMAESGILPDANGFYQITPVASVLDLYNTYYAVSVTIQIDGLAITYNLPITYPEAGPQYEPRAVFSINASNELQGSLWIVKDNQKVTANLGTASFVVRNKAGASIGISQSGITPDANGYFHIAPVSAASIVDFNHYVVDIQITADAVARAGVVGLVVGE
jgi:hypothetical protein